jgi:hypothetical protein
MRNMLLVCHRRFPERIASIILPFPPPGVLAGFLAAAAMVVKHVKPHHWKCLTVICQLDLYLRAWRRSSGSSPTTYF